MDADYHFMWLKMLGTLFKVIVIVY